MKTFIKFIIISTLSLVNFFQNSFSSEKIKIGLIVPTSGEYAQLGNSIIKSVILAINKIGDPRIEIVPKDTKSNPIDSLRVSYELYNQGIRIVIGPVFNESTKYLDDLEEVVLLDWSSAGGDIESRYLDVLIKEDWIDESEQNVVIEVKASGAGELVSSDIRWGNIGRIIDSFGSP